ncbi:MAG: ATP-dependent helicase [bacterium]|nr:ATP-dependent helicase [bacterium]
MLLNYIKAELREEILVNKYKELVKSGTLPSEILVLVQNSNLKKKFSDRIIAETNLQVFEQLNIHSFYSLVYNTISDNWCFVENSISSEKSFILPNLVGLEVSQFLLKDILKNNEVKGYNSKKSLLHQIFRRYSLIVQNNLSNEDVKQRSKILGEAFTEDAEIIMKKLLSSTLKNRSLDYLRQALIFNYIYKNSDYFKNIKYLLADDADEMTPICLEFIKYLKPQLKDWVIGFDSYGSSRCGYLSADTSTEYKLTKLFDETPLQENIAELNEIRFQNAGTIFSNVCENTSLPLKNFTLTSLAKRAEIIDSAVYKIKDLLKNNTKPSDISIITPLQDDMLKFTLKEKLNTYNLLFLSGSEKLIDNPLVKASLNILKLMNGVEITDTDLRVILSDYVGIPLKYTKNILSEYKNSKKLPQTEIDIYNETYQKFRNNFEEIRQSQAKISCKVYEMFNRTVQFVNEDEINKFNFFIKELRDFENVLGEKIVQERVLDIITQIENSIIAENPSSTLEIDDNNIVIATPQKIIDNKISTKYQIWLDASHSDWIKTDTGPLYNAWVFQSDWTKNEYTVEDDIYLSAQKTARILRKLFLLSKKHIWAYSSLFDPTGAENFGGIEKYLISDKTSENNEKPIYKIVPRADQKPVLEYEKGTMAISAVPGAGKTTILLALIMKLLDKGTSPDRIYVLTYMDSAARNFRERIKNMSPNSTQLPNISTIHGLALKIIKENSNYERLGLDYDFEICDDTQRSHIIKNIQGKFLKKDVDDFDRAISVIKLQAGNINTKTEDKKTENFKTFYLAYQQKLQEENLIDYDDILLMAVKLLEENDDILKYYQNICEYIIEDEAQDSSEIQQRLLGLLSGKHKNLIRCGDINQAITTTFSNADVEGFRNFIKTSDTNVEMNMSQRCTQEVMDLANNTVLWGEQNLPSTFYKIMMQGVEGKNPISKEAVKFEEFEKQHEEQRYILKEIKNILTYEKNATIGILLRMNYQVGKWTSFINDAGFKSITRSESLGQKSVFNTIFSVLKFLQTPFDNEACVSLYEKLSELGFYKPRLQAIIRNCTMPFITLNGDEIDSPDIAQFLWDIQYWLNSSTLPLEELVIRIGLFYYSSDIEKSNVYLIAILVKKLNSNNNYDSTLERLETLSKKSSLSGFKFFSEEEDNSAIKGKVQIMTMHKSKGDEFDYVFIPELSEKSLSMDVNSIDLKSSASFMEDVRGFNPQYKKKNEAELKAFAASEAMRLFYVAVTRAKKKIYITTSKKVKSFYGKELNEAPSIVFEKLK